MLISMGATMEAAADEVMGRNIGGSFSLLDELAQLAYGVPPFIIRNRHLEEIASNGWVVSSPELADLLGHDPVEGQQDGGYRFCRQGDEWQVFRDEL
jgi:hypothetical protein